MAGGTYPVTVTASGGGATKTALLAINVLPPPSFSLTLSPTSLTVAPGAYGTTTASTIRTTTFNSAVSVKVTGMPAGVTATFGPATLSASGNGSSVLKLSATSTATIGSAQVAVKATAGSVTRTLSLALSVTK
jgi:hypothetical protein